MREKRVEIDRLVCLFVGCFISAGHLAARGIFKKMKRSFSLEGEKYQLLTTYQPAHIDLQVIDKRSGKLKKGVFYDSTLPEPVRQECEAVSDLYEFLERKTAQEIVIEEDRLRFKVVNIKKERWYSLQVEEEAQAMQEMREEEKVEDMKGSGLMEAERDQLIIDNQSLRNETFQLRKTNNQLLQMLSLERQKQTIKSSPIRDPQPMSPMEQQALSPTSVGKRSQWINLRASQFSNYYRVDGNCITKISEDSGMLILSPAIQGEKVLFGLKIVSRLYNNWIIFGVIAQQHRNRSYCYFQQKCLAFSGSMGLIFNQHEIIDLGIIPSQGDCIRVCIDYSQKTIEWSLNDRKISHKLPESMTQEPLLPFLMLSRSGDSILLLQE